MKFIILFFICSSLYSQEIVLNGIDTVSIENSYEFLDFKSAYLAHSIYKNKQANIINLTVKSNKNKQERNKEISDFYYILRELSDNKNEKALKLKIKINEIYPELNEVQLVDLYLKIKNEIYN